MFVAVLHSSLGGYVAATTPEKNVVAAKASTVVKENFILFLKGSTPDGNLKNNSIGKFGHHHGT